MINSVFCSRLDVTHQLGKKPSLEARKVWTWEAWCWLEVTQQFLSSNPRLFFYARGGIWRPLSSSLPHGASLMHTCEIFLAFWMLLQIPRGPTCRKIDSTHGRFISSLWSFIRTSHFIPKKYFLPNPSLKLVLKSSDLERYADLIPPLQLSAWGLSVPPQSKSAGNSVA